MPFTHNDLVSPKVLPRLWQARDIRVWGGHDQMLAYASATLLPKIECSRSGGVNRGLPARFDRWRLDGGNYSTRQELILGRAERIYSKMWRSNIKKSKIITIHKHQAATDLIIQICKTKQSITWLKQNMTTSEFSKSTKWEKLKKN